MFFSKKKSETWGNKRAVRRNGKQKKKEDKALANLTTAFKKKNNSLCFKEWWPLISNLGLEKEQSLLIYSEGKATPTKYSSPMKLYTNKNWRKNFSLKH